MKYVVIDLEMNPVDRAHREVRRHLYEEVIEFGAVRLDENFKQEDSFQCYVEPEYNNICKHITNLTSITQGMVAGKGKFKEHFFEFIDWIGDEPTKIYSWSMSDIKQLKKEAAYKIPNFNTAWLDERWVDLQQEFDDRLGLHNSLALKHALGAMEHKFEGTQHTALADAINTSAILVLMQDDKKFRATMQPVLDILEPKEELTNSLGDLFPDLMKLKGNL